MTFASYIKNVLAVSKATITAKGRTFTTQEILSITKPADYAIEGKFYVMLIGQFNLDWLIIYFYCLLNNIPVVIVSPVMNPKDIVHYIITLPITHIFCDETMPSDNYEYVEDAIASHHCIVHTRTALQVLATIKGPADAGFASTVILYFTPGITTFPKLVCVTGYNIKYFLEQSRSIPHVSTGNRYMQLDPTRYHALVLLSGLLTDQQTVIGGNSIPNDGIVYTTRSLINKYIELIKFFIFKHYPLARFWLNTRIGTWFIKKKISKNSALTGMVIVGDNISKSTLEYFPNLYVANLYGMAETLYTTSLLDVKTNTVKMYHPIILDRAPVGKIKLASLSLCIYHDGRINDHYVDPKGYFDTTDYGVLVHNRIIVLGKTPVFNKPGLPQALNKDLEYSLSKIPFIKEAQFLKHNGKCILLIYPDLKSAEEKNLNLKDLQYLYDILVLKLNHDLDSNFQIQKAVIFTERFQRSINGEIKRFLYNDAE